MPLQVGWERPIIKPVMTFTPPLLAQRLSKPLKRGFWKLQLIRQRVVNRILSNLYGQQMQVMPAGHVGLAGALVLWMVQDGGRQLVMLRSPGGRDSRARLVSCMGIGRHPDVATALKAAVKTQLGEMFTKTLTMDKVALDRVAAAPMFSYTDEMNGITSPMQVLVWVMQVQPVQLELLKLQEGTELVLVNERALSQGKVSWVAPTHAALWRSVARHLPQRVLPFEEDAGAREERVEAAEMGTGRRLLH